MSRFYSRFHSGVEMLLAGGAGLCMALLFVIIFANAVLRYFVGSSLAWGGQLPIFLGIYGVMFGVALAYLQDRHVRLGLLVDFLPLKAREGLLALVDLSVIVLGALIVLSGERFLESRGGMRISGMTGLADNVTALTGLPMFQALKTMAPYQFAMILGGVLLWLAGILRLIDRVQAWRQPAVESSMSKGGV
ncbi:TRAP transporter small permease subunit [Salinicola sp. CPA57]|uniref:TRAP transporter small permease n=1 Tax=Salinicola sp. CPA57 TaxID=1949080 RepID=UPI000DA22E47|nr:TRAP transporter small permease subunit [Salinicola sp. CPA57]